MKTKAKAITTAITLALLFLGLVLSLSYRNTASAAEPSERFLGYNTEKDKWTTGNLGPAYVEGDFVSYQLRIDVDSKVWGATEFSISFNFHQDSSNAIYIDGFDISTATGFQYQIDGSFLPDGQPTPSPAWTHIPTPEAGESWSSGPKITNYMDPWPPGFSEPTDPNAAQVADERYFSVNGLPWGSATSNIILFYRAHLALDIIWSAGLESDLPQVLDGGEFDEWTNMFMGSSFATGSSRHFFLQYPGIGGKTIPIPIAQYPSTMINGHKYVDNVLFDGWEITLSGLLTLGSGLPPIPYNPPPVLTGTPPWTTGYFEFTGLVTGSYTVDEEEMAGYEHLDIMVTGDATNIVINIPGGWASFDLEQGGTATVDFDNVLPGNINGYKYEDMAGDGPGGTDVPIDGWAITLWMGSTNLGTVYTGTGDWPDGYYEFTDLLSGDYRVVEEDRIGWTHTSPSFVDVSLSPGETETANFYNFKNVKISGYKWNDLDGDGIWDAGEVGLGDWTIELYKWNGAMWGFQTSTTTSSEMANLGYYEFTNLGPGRYKVNEVDQLKWVQSYPVSPNYYDITVTSGTDVSSRNFGNFHPKIQLTVCTTYDSDRESVTFMVTVTNPLPSAPGVTITTLKDVTVTSTLLGGPTIGPVDVNAGGSESLAAPFTYTFQPGDPATFIVTFTATGLDADGDTVTVDITVTVTQP